MNANGSQEDMTPWLVAVSAALGCVVLVDLALYLVAACRLGKAPAVHEQGADESRAQSEQVRLPPGGSGAAALVGRRAIGSGLSLV